MKSFYFKLLSISIISCLGIIVYSNTFSCSFHFDDKPYIVNDLAIKNIHDLQKIWEFCPCRFVTFLTLALNYHFHQLNVFGYHLFNLAVHLGSACFVWWLTLLTLSTPVMKKNKIAQHADIIALLTGLVFVSHPIQTEAVTFIWQRTASLATLFYLASLCFYVKSRSLKDNKPIKSYYISALITAVMAMFTKENTITLPLMFLLYEFSFFENKKNFNWRYLSPFLLTILIIPATMLLFKTNRFQEIQGVVKGPEGISPMHYLLTQFRVMITYIRLVFLPFNQNLDYDYPVFKSILEFPVFISFSLLIIILWGAILLFSKYRLLSFSIFWFFLTLLPESSVLPLKDVIFEHRLYLPLAGYSMFLVGSVYYLWGMNNFKTMIKVLIAIIACYSFLTYQRNKVWKDEITLWDDAVQKSPHKARTYNNRGDIYTQEGNFSQALSDYDKAIRLDPAYADAYNNRGSIYGQQGDFTRALSDLNKAIELDPDYADAYNNRGNVFGKKGDLNQALADFNKAIEIYPNDAAARYNRGVILKIQGDIIGARSEYNKAIEIDTDIATGRVN